MNKCFFTGNVTKDPNAGTTSSGVPYCRFSIAVQSRFKNPNGEYDVEFIDISTWRGLAEKCSELLSKGSKVAVVGELKTDTYQGRDGIPRRTFCIQADEVEVMPRGSKAPKAEEPKEETKPVDEELPF